MRNRRRPPKIGGFFPTYLYPIATTGFHTSTIVHVHGLLFFSWTLLFIVQSRLAVTSLPTHRSLGLVGISLATGMVFAGLAVISGGLNEVVQRGTEMTARLLAIVPAFAISMFAVTFVLAIAYRRRPEYHKRFMVLATVALMAPAIVRAMIMTVGVGGFGMSSVESRSSCYTPCGRWSRRRRPGTASRTG